MNQKIYQEKDLPWEELQELCLASKGKLLLTQGDKDALLSGRRSSLMQLSDIHDSNLHISAIDVKLSLKADENGKLRLQAHPIHNYPEVPLGLEEQEAAQLISGEKKVIHKEKSVEERLTQETIFEYDPETREFIKTDPLKIIVPDKVNGQMLTAAQRDWYKKGKEVEINDGTAFRYTGVDPDPIRSNRLLVIASILVDGGLTYLAFEGLRAFAGNKNHDPKAGIKSEAYKDAHAEMEAHKTQNNSADTDQTRGYTRAGHSR